MNNHLTTVGLTTYNRKWTTGTGLMTISTASDWDNCRNPRTMLDLLTIAEQEWMSATNWTRRLVPSLRKLRLFVFAMTAKARGIEGARNGYEKWEDGEPGTDDDKEYYGSPIRNARSWIESPEGSITADDQANILRDIIGNPFSPVMISKLVETSKPKDNRMFGDLQIVDPPWLTPQVVSLAQAAYQERDRRCLECKGEAFKYNLYGGRTDCPACDGTGNGANNSSLDPVRLMVLADALEEAGCDSLACEACKGRKGGYANIQDDLHLGWVKCLTCHGVGRLPHPILSHLRSPGPHYRGCWVLDHLLGYE